MNQRTENPGQSEAARKDALDAPCTIFDNYLGLQDGMFRVEMDHVLVQTAKQGDSSGQENRVRTEVWKSESALSFQVKAPRLLLPASGVISSKFPGPGTSAPFQSILPYIAFSRRSLPWERTMGSVGDTPTEQERVTPWLALLVMTRGELDQGRLRNEKASVLVAPSDTHYSPWTDDALKAFLTLSEQEQNAEITLLDISADVFRTICPNATENALLAHVRKVDLRKKAEGRDGQTGDFALLMANRFPRSGEHVAMVVSLEGWARWLALEQHSSKHMVRLVVLHSWTFFSEDGVGTCAEMAKRLNCGTFRFSDEILAHVEGTEAGAPLRHGYTPVQYQSNEAGKEPIVAWYRGPLAPVEVAPFPADTKVFQSADAALVVRPELGMVDISYAAGWEVGRLLALSSSSFSAALQRFSEDVFLAHMRLEERKAIAAQRNAQAKYEAASVPSLWDEMIQFAEKEVKRKEGDPPTSLREDVRIILEWLESLLLLEPLPLRYLVPSDKLLPPNSIRMFHIDSRWTDAAIDGAMSIGEYSLSGAHARPMDRGSVRRALRFLIGRRRARMSDTKEVQDSSLEEAAAAPLTGFLLRSELIDVCPGVEIAAQQEGANVRMLRLTSIAPGLFIGLCRGRPTKIVIREPREGLRFGVSEKSVVLKETTGAATGKLVDISAMIGNDKRAPGVLDVQSIAASLAPKIGQEKLTSATFALQMLLAAEDVAIPWQGLAVTESSSTMKGER